MASDVKGKTDYGFCRDFGENARKRLLAVSDTAYNKTPLDTFLETLNRKTDTGGQRKVKATPYIGGGEAFNHYRFSHFEDVDKYMKRYRYYNTVGDTGQIGIDPKDLGIDVPGGSTDRCSTILGSVCSLDNDEFRQLLLSSRRSISDLSMTSSRRNKSAPASRKTSKRVFLTWEQYVEMCDVPQRQGHFDMLTEGAVSFQEDEETALKSASERKAMSAYPRRRSGRDSCESKSASPKTDTDNCESKQNCVEKGTLVILPEKHPPMTLAKSELTLSEHQKKKASVRVVHLEKPKPIKISTDKSHTKSGRQQARFINKESVGEGGCKTVVAKKEKTSLPEGKSIHTAVKQEGTKKVENCRLRNSRVNAMYKFTKVKRKQIHS